MAPILIDAENMRSPGFFFLTLMCEFSESRRSGGRCSADYLPDIVVKAVRCSGVSKDWSHGEESVREELVPSGCTAFSSIVLDGWR